MSQNKFLENLFAQEMNRREFLARIGATGLALVGVTGLLKTLWGAYSAIAVAVGLIPVSPRS